MIKHLMIAAVALTITAPAHANFFTDTVDAIRGHVTDINDRINHDDEFVTGDVHATSMFRDTDSGRDAAHWADGTVELVERDGKWFIQLGADFVSGPAPDLYVYAADRVVFDETSFWNAETTEIGKLVSGSGASYYELTGIDVELEYLTHGEIEIVIWCKRFGAFIAATTLDL